MKKILIAIGIALSCAQASAQWVVVDPTNLIQTTLTAVRAATAEAARIAQAKRELQMLATTDLTSSFNADYLISGLNSLDGSANQLRGLLEKQGDINTTLASMYGASSASTPEEFTALLNKRQAAGDESVTALMDGSKDIGIAMKQANADHDRIVGAIPNVAGVTQAAQLTGQTVGIVVQQMNASLGYQQIQMATQAAKDARENKERQAADQARVDYFNEGAALLKRNQ